MGLVEKDFRVKCDRPLPLSYFLDGKGDRDKIVEFINIMSYFARISAIPQVSIHLCLHVDRKLSRYPG
jgi:hypothetical protein